MKTYFIRIILLLLIGSFPHVLFAQSMSLRLAVDYAINNNLRIKQSNSQIQQQQALNSGATGLLLPKVSLSGGYTWFNGNPEINMAQMKPAIDDMFGKYGTVMAQELNLSSGTQEEIYNDIVNGLSDIPVYNLEIDFNQFPNASINAIQPLFTGGKISSTRNLSSVQLKMAMINHEGSKDIVTKEVIDRYLTVLLLDAIVDNREENLISIKKHIEHSKRLVDEGIVTRHSLLKAEVALSNAERMLEADQNRLVIARMSLNNSLDFSQDTIINLADSLKFKLHEINIAQLKEKAKNEQVLLQIVDQKKQMAEYSLNLEKSAMMPQIFAFANYSFFNEYMPVIMPPLVAGVQLQYNIFNGMSDQKKVKAAKYFNEEVLISKENTQQKVDFWIEKSYLKSEDAKYRYLKLGKTVELAREHRDIVQKRYNEGIERSIDVVDGHQIYQTAQIEQLMTLYEYYIALTDLYFAVGTPDEVINIISK